MGETGDTIMSISLDSKQSFEKRLAEEKNIQNEKRKKLCACGWIWKTSLCDKIKHSNDVPWRFISSLRTEYISYREIFFCVLNDDQKHELSKLRETKNLKFIFIILQQIDTDTIIVNKMLLSMEFQVFFNKLLCWLDGALVQLEVDLNFGLSWVDF